MHDSLKHVLVLCCHAYLSIQNILHTATLACTPYHVCYYKAKFQQEN